MDSELKGGSVTMGATGPQGKVEIGAALKLKAVSIKPNKKCKKCMGLGRLGFVEGKKDRPLPCKCVRKQVDALVKEGKIDKDTRIDLDRT